jgi:hypothetical protein
MMDKRLSNNLLNYWNSIKKGDDAFPEIDFFDIKSTLISEIWNKCLLITINDINNMTLKYEYIGADIAAVFGDDCEDTSRERFSFSYNPLTKILGKTRAISFMKNPRAIKDSGNYELVDKKIIKYRSCLLPFGKDNILKQLVIGISWKVSTYD